MAATVDTDPLEAWTQRASTMIGYLDAAREFVRRAAEQVDAFEADVSVVCLLWALADECDVLVCEALRAFDRGLAGDPGELDITRGLEIVPPGSERPGVNYQCSWSLRHSLNEVVSVVLSISQIGSEPRVEVIDPLGSRRTVRMPIEDPSPLYEALAYAFFEMAVSPERSR